MKRRKLLRPTRRLITCKFYTSCCLDAEESSYSPWLQQEQYAVVGLKAA